jgi:hypothetical protein
MANDPVTDDYIGYAMLKRLKASPGAVGQVTVDDADSFICQQRDKVLICWVLVDNPEAGTGGKLFVQNTITLME